jgi:hypothetical protein
MGALWAYKAVRPAPFAKVLNAGFFRREALLEFG